VILWVGRFYILSVQLVINSFLPTFRGVLLVKIFMTKNIAICFTLILSLGALNACSQQIIPNSQGSNTAQQTSNNTQINTAASNTATTGISAPIVAPPSYGDRPLKPDELPTAQTLPNGLPALKPLKGVNVDRLFAENLRSSDDRFERLENAVVDMRREFEAVKPAIVRLVAVEEDIQQMVEQLEIMASQEQTPYRATQQPYPNNPPPSAAPQNITPNQPVIRNQAAKPMPAPTTTPSRSYTGPTVKNLRTGQHSGKTRLVLDMSANTPYTIDLDTSENILVIELPQAGWSGARSKTFSAKEPVIASYSVQSMGGNAGTRIIIPLKKSSQILDTKLLPPGSNPNHRMYVDLKS